MFCEAHHRQALERAGSGAALPPKDLLRLIVGPLWLNLARVGAVAAATATLDLRTAALVIAGISTVSAIVGWRLSRRLVWQPQLGFPIAFSPTPSFIVPVGAYCFALAALVATLTFAAVRVAE